MAPSALSPGRPREAKWLAFTARIICKLARCALAAAVTAYEPGGFGGTISAPAGTDSDAGTKLLNKHFPSSAANPTNLIYKLSQPVWNNPDPINTAAGQLTASGLFIGITGPLNPAGVTLTSAQYKSLHTTLGDPRALPPIPPTGQASVPVA
jgi:hypothetical protein